MKTAQPLTKKQLRSSRYYSQVLRAHEKVGKRGHKGQEFLALKKSKKLRVANNRPTKKLNVPVTFKTQAAQRQSGWLSFIPLAIKKFFGLFKRRKGHERLARPGIV